MTDQPPFDANEPAPQTESAGGFSDDQTPESAAASRGREWLAQLEAMIQNVAREAAPVAREVGAKAAELAAVAAVKAGPIAQKAAEATVEYGQRFAERAQTAAADWRSENAARSGNGHATDVAVAEPPAEVSDDPQI